MSRIAAIFVLDNLDDRDSLMEWAEEHGHPFTVLTDQRFIAEVADSLPTDPSVTTLLELKRGD